MQITPADLSSLTFTPEQNTDVTERVFRVTDNEDDYLVLAHVDKKQTDTDGDGEIDTLDGKFTLSLITNDGVSDTDTGKEIKMSQVHSLAVGSVISGDVDIADWVGELTATMIPKLIHKKATVNAWLNF